MLRLRLVIIFLVHNSDESEYVETKVIDTRHYDSLEVMLATEDFKKVLPDKDSVAQGIQVYRQFYSKEQERQFGVVAIEVRLI